MASHTPPTQLLAILLIAVLAAACVKQPADDGALNGGQDLGVVAAPMTAEEIQEATGEQLTRKERKRARRQRQRQAARAEQTGTAGKTGKAGKARTVAAASGTSDSQVRPGGAGAATQSSPAAPAQFIPLLSFDDRPGDASGQSPAYADIQRVVIESDGTAARVTVVFADDLPPALADGEVQGVGIDFYRSAGRESDFQLFADGGYKGWRAFLHTPKGVVPFTGAFRVGGAVMVFEVPWKALGGARAAEITVFADWSQQRTLLNAVGNDRAPNSGRLTVRPRA